MKNKKISRKEKFFKLLPFLIGAILGLLLMPFLDKILYSSETIIVGIINIVVGFVLAYYLAIILHEAGHLIFGLLTGYKFVSFRIGSLTLIRSNGKFKLKKYNIVGTGGQCLLDPPELDKDSKYPVILYNMGGGLINILTSLLFIYINRKYELSGLLLSFVYGSIFSGILGIINIIPLKMGGVSNDGYNLLMLLKDEDSRIGFWRMLRVNRMLVDGVRVKDMDKKIFEKIEGGDMSNPLVNYVDILKVDYYIDRGEFHKAKDLIGELLKEPGILGIHKNELTCELIFLELIAGNYEEAKKLFNGVEKYIEASKKYNPGRRRLNYAYELFVNEDKEKGDRELAEFNKLLKTYPYKSSLESERELIKLVKSN